MEEIGKLNSQLLPEYRLLRRIGTGGNRNVYLAEANKGGLNYQCVIKFKKADKRKEYVGEDPREEARILMNLRHPNVENLYDFGVFKDGRFWVATEFINGENLESFVIKNGPMRLMDCFCLFSQVISVLKFIHANNLIHRDLTLRNIMICNDKTAKVDYCCAELKIFDSLEDELVKVTDFQLIKESSNITNDDNPWTRHYLPPLFYRGERLSSPFVFDLYALGVCIYRAITGEYLVDFTKKRRLDTIDFWKRMEVDDIFNFLHNKVTTDLVEKHIPYWEEFGTLVSMLINTGISQSDHSNTLRIVSEDLRDLIGDKLFLYGELYG